MKLVFVNIMQELQKFDSTAYITQPPVPLAVLNAATLKSIETALIDEQADCVRFEGDVFAFSVSTQNASAVYDHADALRTSGKKVILGGIHITVCPDEAIRHADAIVTGEAETSRCRQWIIDFLAIGVISRPLLFSPPGAVIAGALSV